MQDQPPVSRWDHLKDVFAAALAVEPGSRPQRIADACAGDAALAAEVEALISAHERAAGFLETPALSAPEAARAVAEAAERGLPDGTVIDRCGAYRIIRELGRGGMGVVYLGARDDDRFEKLAAIKVVSTSLVHPILLQRFEDERRILASLDHPNIARLLDAGTTDADVPYVVMEYIEGDPIDVFCATRRLGVRERLTLFSQVCAAVQYSHQRLVVHRDIKARNILVGSDGTPKLLDFGIAKLLEPGGVDPHATRTAFRALTPESASPEQVRGEPVTVATDIYSLGVLLYRLLTGSSPYRGDMTTEPGIMHAICDEQPRRPSEAVAGRDGAAAGVPTSRELRGDLDLITLKALSKDRSQRYASVEQMADDVARHLGGRPVLARPATLRYRATKFVARHKAGVAAAALVAVTLVGGVIATAWEARVAGIERGRAERRFNDVRRLANSFLFEFHDAIAELPGSTKARELVVQRATEYLDSLSRESASDASLQRELAAAYDRVGDVQGLPQFANLGNTAAALQSHLRALALRQALVTASPSDAALEADLLQTYSHLGLIEGAMKDLPAALDYDRKAFAIRAARLASHPSGAAERRSVAVGYYEIGGVMSQMGDWPAALDNFRQETVAFEALLALDPANRNAQRDVSIAYKQLGAVLEQTGDRTSAVADYRKAVALDEARAGANASDGQAHLDLSYGYASIGHALAVSGDIAGSLQNYQRALELRERVAAADPRDANAADTVVRAHLSIGQVLRGARRFSEAVPHLTKALAIASARYAADPANGTAGERLAYVYGSLASAQAGIAAASKDTAEASRAWHEARAAARTAADLWVGQRAKSALSAAAQAELTSLEQLVAKCDREIARLGR